MPASSPLSRMNLVVAGLPHYLEVLKFDGRTAVSQPFRFNVELVNPKADLNLERFLHALAFLAFDDQGHGVFGQIQCCAQYQENNQSRIEGHLAGGRDSFIHQWLITHAPRAPLFDGKSL